MVLVSTFPSIMALCQREEFNARFSDLRGYKDDFKLFTSPFDVDVESAPSEVQMELVDLQCSDELKSRFAAVGHADFWRKYILPTKRFLGCGKCDEDFGCIRLHLLL